MQCQDSPTWGQHCRLWPACGLDGQSVTTTNTAAATGLRFSQLMSSQSNLSVCELPYSSCFHTHICMHTRSQKHTAHIDLQYTAEGMPFIKDLQAELCLFVCICDYGLAVSSLLSHAASTAPKSKYSFMYFFIWSCPVKTRTRFRHFWFMACRENQVLDILSQPCTSFIRERRLCLLHSCLYWGF